VVVHHLAPITLHVCTAGRLLTPKNADFLPGAAAISADYNVIMRYIHRNDIALGSAYEQAFIMSAAALLVCSGEAKKICFRWKKRARR